MGVFPDWDSWTLKFEENRSKLLFWGGDHFMKSKKSTSQIVTEKCPSQLNLFCNSRQAKRSTCHIKKPNYHHNFLKLKLNSDLKKCDVNLVQTNWKLSSRLARFAASLINTSGSNCSSLLRKFCRYDLAVVFCELPLQLKSRCIWFILKLPNFTQISLFLCNFYKQKSSKRNGATLLLW